jgi:hypothetical protein
MNLKIIGGGKMKAKQGGTGKYLRFCDLCGSYVGNMGLREWQQEGRMCKRCAEVYAGSLEIKINQLSEGRYSWELSSERNRISRLL